MLLREETNFFVFSLRHYSVLIFSFSDIKRGYTRITSQVFSKNLRNQRTLSINILCNYCIKARKLPMLKQGVKTISAEFIRKGALSQLSFIQFRPYATSFWGLLLSLTLMPKSKKTMETSLNLTPLFKTCVDPWVKSLVSNVDYLENRCRNFIQKVYGRKRRLPRTHISFSGLRL